jgi:hypothetical protein
MMLYKIPESKAKTTGSDSGNAVGSDASCPRFSGCGYDPQQARVAGEGLALLRGLAPALRDVPLQVQEYAPSKPLKQSDQL